jgi:hypothetical protein
MLNCSKTTIALLFALTMLSLPSFAGSKVEICHTPPGNIQQTETITVGEKSLPAHIAHGDKVGSCFQSLCPCAGVSSDPTQTDAFKWDDNFDATPANGGSCYTFETSGEIRNDEYHFLTTSWDGEYGGTCQVGNDGPNRNITSQEEAQACIDSIKQIAFHDGLGCD